MADTHWIIWALPVIAGVLNGFAWAVPAFTRIPSLAFIGAGFLIAVPFEAVWLFSAGMPETVKPEFWSVTIINAALLVVAFVMLAAIPKCAPLILTRPIGALTPVAVLILSIAMGVGDLPGKGGTIGIAMMVGAVYLLNLEKGMDVWGPFRAIAHSRGALMQLGVVMIFMVTSNLDYIAAKAASGPFYLVVCHSFVGIGCLILAALDWLWRPAQYKGVVSWRNFGFCAIFGTLFAVSVIAHIAAFSWIPTVSYVIGIKESLTAVIGGTSAIVLGWLGLKSHYGTEEKKSLVTRIPALGLIAAGLMLVVTG